MAGPISRGNGRLANSRLFLKWADIWSRLDLTKRPSAERQITKVPVLTAPHWVTREHLLLGSTILSERICKLTHSIESLAPVSELLRT